MLNKFSNPKCVQFHLTPLSVYLYKHFPQCWTQPHLTLTILMKSLISRLRERERKSDVPAFCTQRVQLKKEKNNTHSSCLTASPVLISFFSLETIYNISAVYVMFQRAHWCICEITSGKSQKTSLISQFFQSIQYISICSPHSSRAIESKIIIKNVWTIHDKFPGVKSTLFGVHMGTGSHLYKKQCYGKWFPSVHQAVLI